MTEKLLVKRLDVFLVEQGLQPSRERAKEAVASGLVSVNGVVSLKPSRPVTVEDEVICRKGAPRYVGRGGEKLEKALREARLDVRGLTALDVGASTGGFTDCLLQHGAAEVFSVDVGHDQLHPSLRQDTRVHSLEGTDIRRTECMMELLGGRRPDFCTVDVSFISLEQVGSAVFSLLSPAAPVVWLIKPQFEAGRGAVGKKGIVRQKSDHVRVLEKACAFFYSQGYGVCWLSHSPIRGGEGNVEYLTVLRKNDAEETIRTTVDEVVEKAWRELGGRG